MQDSSKSSDVTIDSRVMAKAVVFFSFLTWAMASGFNLFQGEPVTRALSNAVAGTIGGIIAWLCYFLVCRRFNGLGIMMLIPFMMAQDEGRSFLEDLVKGVFVGTPTGCFGGLLMRFYAPSKPSDRSDDVMSDIDLDGVHQLR